MEVGAVLSLWEHNQSVISAAHVLLLSPGPLKEWPFCAAAYAPAIKFLTGARMCLYLQILGAGHKVLCLAFVYGRLGPAGPRIAFLPQ